jgi:hypothetical protein
VVQPAGGPSSPSAPPPLDEYVFFTLDLPPDLPTGTVVTIAASVFYGTSAPIDAPDLVYTVDNTPPVSSVTALPASSPTETFAVNWSGNDPGNAGIAHYDIFVSDNGGPYTLFQQATTATSAMFTGAPGHTYGFYSRAIDNVGNVEARHTTADTQTTINVVQGDMNGDGVVDGDDIAAFVGALVDPVAWNTQWNIDHPDKPMSLDEFMYRADLNHDGYVDGDDIVYFVALLMGGNAPAPGAPVFAATPGLQLATPVQPLADPSQLSAPISELAIGVALQSPINSNSPLESPLAQQPVFTIPSTNGAPPSHAEPSQESTHTVALAQATALATASTVDEDLLDTIAWDQVDRKLTSV